MKGIVTTLCKTAIACVFMVLAVMNVKATDVEPWNGNSYEDFAGGTGTEGDPYQIANGKQLYNLYIQCKSDTEYRSAYYVLMNDIDMNNMLFPGITVFNGHLDGNGKTIYGFYESVKTSKYAGLICQGTGCVIEDLTIKGTIESTGTYAAGAFVGYMTNGIIKNCTNYCTISALKATGVGGIVGRATITGQILNCYNKVTIVGNQNVSGICGTAAGATRRDDYGNIILISECYNIADILGTTNVGGICGKQESSTIEKSFNTGDISGTTCVGGVVGYGYAENCTSWGTTNGRVFYSYYRYDTYVKDCFNTGMISATENYAGGIAGKYNYCNTSSSGGVAGHSSSKAGGGILHSYNTGIVSSLEFVGGIVGNGNFDVTDSYWLTGTCTNGTEKGIECTENLMKQAGCYEEFDFQNTWSFGIAGDYTCPLLKCFGYPTISFVDFDGRTISQKAYFYGEKVVVPSNPSRAADFTYTYEFAGWNNKVFETCIEDATYQATYQATYIDYTVVFKDYNGSVISSRAYHYGDEINIPANPSRESTVQYFYEFKGWDRQVNTVCQGNVIYTAQYEQKDVEYTIEFRDYDGRVISSEKYIYGEAPNVPSNPSRAADFTYTYEFAGWNKTVVNCKGDAVYTATYTKQYIAYTVVFKDYDGTVISNITYHYGDTVSVPKNPIRESELKYTYDFSGWDKEVETVCLGSATYKATYEQKDREYTIVFKNYDGSVLSCVKYLYEQMPQIPSTPTREKDNIYRYEFCGWDKEVDACKGDATYTAVYNKFYIDYTITFKDYEGTVISSATYHYGEVVKVPTNPTRKADRTYTYEFAGWDKNVVNCEGNTEYTATYKKTYINYTVVFKNYDGTVISSATYHYGENVKVPTNPTRKADKTYVYEFAGWDKKVVNCEGNTEYMATYEKSYIDYTVVFKNYDGTVLRTLTCHYGDEIQIPTNPSRKADKTYTYEFAGWDKKVSTKCEGNAIYVATYNKTYIEYTIVFKDYDGTVISNITYHYEDAISVPNDLVRASDMSYNYSFSGWDKQVSTKCGGNATYTATYSKQAIEYTVVFKNYDGTILRTLTCHYGDDVVEPSKPSRGADKIYWYEFTGWDKEVRKCEGDEVYTATYLKHYVEYTVVFKDYDGKVIQNTTYIYGDKVVVPENPVRESDEVYSYEFNGWDKEIVSCVENAVYTATYKVTCISHQYGEWTIVKHPTDKEEGEKEHICQRCGEKESVTIDKITSTWKYDGIGWWYQNANGTYPANCWKEIDNVWYYFNASGYILTGWQSIGGTWYYFNGSGAMLTGWQSIGGTWYYFMGSGAMVTGWQLIDDTWYYFAGSGAMMSGWQSIGGTWYYFAGSGAMATGWQSIGGTWYYFNGSGAMLTGWQLIGGAWYYLEGSGAMVTNRWVGNYYLQADGTMATNKWIGSYYVGADGVWVP